MPGPSNQRDDSKPTYVLITQCLQNDFFFNARCRLCLPERQAAGLLMSGDDDRGFSIQDDRRTLSGESLQRGPLAQFLGAVIGQRMEGHGEGVLHVINIRDWHRPGDRHYERERRQYGAHCEVGSWGADYIEGLTSYLDPAKSSDYEGPITEPAFSKGTVRLYHIRSNTVFDFKRKEGKKPQEETRCDLEVLLDELVSDRADNARVVVIGVLTDIKVQLLLTTMRARYNRAQLVVSDSLTASPSVERHLAALDFSQKVLWVEVMHGLSEVVRFLGVDLERSIDEPDHGFDFSRYATYFQDKQNVFAYGDARLDDYRKQTARRLNQLQRAVVIASTSLMSLGFTFLFLTVGLIVAAAIWPERVQWELTLVTGTIGLAQLVTIFFARPMNNLIDALTNATIFRMTLESHSLKVALARFHVTTPQSLVERATAEEQLAVLNRHLELLDQIDQSDFDRLAALGIGRRTSGEAEAEVGG